VILTTKSKATFSIRPGTPEDVPEATLLIHEAFEMWKQEGLKLSPMYQSEETTAKHLVTQGYVVHDHAQNMVGTFSLDSSRLTIDSEAIAVFREGTSAMPLNFTLLEAGKAFANCDNKLLVFKKAAVRPVHSNQGLGRAMYEFAENFGKQNGYDGIVIETVQNAEWLYRWYLDLGFTPIGKYIYPSSAVETILMIKIFPPKKFS
jgi:predicted N-acetyltransferase YhbS